VFVDQAITVANAASSTTATMAYSQAVTIESLFGPQNGSTDTAFSFTDANTAGTANATFKGVAIVFASSEMEEILGMSDRVLVMHEGRITGELSRHQLSEEAILHLATGTASTASTAPSSPPCLS
jgi:ABC-type polysaccharide/polyol phosphate transport system ATPase subunit